MNPDAFHDATHIALALREDVALTAEGGGLVLRGRTRGLRFSTVSQSQHAALAALARPNGATEVELEELIAATDGPDDLAAWFFRLDQLLQTNLLRQVVVADDVPLISAWTMRGSGLSPVTANSGDRTFKMSRFAYVHAESDRLLAETPLSAARVA